MGVGPGLCELRRITLPRTPVNKAVAGSAPGRNSCSACRGAGANIGCERQVGSERDGLPRVKIEISGRGRERTTNVIRAEESVEIHRPVEEVFSYTSNPENFPEWAATVIEVRQEDAPGEGDPLNREGKRFTLMQQPWVGGLRPLRGYRLCAEPALRPKGKGKIYASPGWLVVYEPLRGEQRWKCSKS
jgi:hypothetical protein